MATKLESALSGKKMDVVVFSPHPDDAAIGVGGTIKRLIDAGSSVKVVTLTTGERGSPEAMEDPSLRDELSKRRSKEEQACAEFLGYESIQLGLKSSEIESARKIIETEFSQTDIILVTHPDEAHSTHKATTSIISSIPFSAEIWGYEVWTPIAFPDISIDISKIIDAKLSAIRMHRSQILNKSFDDGAKGLARYRAVFSHHIEKGFEYAECLKRLKPVKM